MMRGAAVAIALCTNFAVTGCAARAHCAAAAVLAGFD
jgi:hypothetical protein